jgi:hypothetical protein
VQPKILLHMMQAVPGRASMHVRCCSGQASKVKNNLENPGQQWTELNSKESGLTSAWRVLSWRMSSFIRDSPNVCTCTGAQHSRQSNRQSNVSVLHETTRMQPRGAPLAQCSCCQVSQPAARSPSNYAHCMN